MNASRRGYGRAGSITAGCVLGALLALVAVAAEEPTTAQGPIPYGPGKEIARLANPEITESSGLAPSRIRPGAFWTHNDAGDKPRLFAFNDKGADLGAYMIQGATAVDWEDMASFSIGKRPYLLVGDVGDNQVRRKSYTLYLVAEPPVAAEPPRPASLPLAARMDFTYEDGPHNCESLAVDPVRREILLVSKTAEAGCKVYVLPLPREARVRDLVAKAVATLQVPTTTAMDVSPDGLRAVVLTYTDAYEYTREAKEDWGAAFGRAPRTIRMPPRPQGESICYGPDGRTLYLTSERAPSPLLQVSPEGPAGDAAGAPLHDWPRAIPKPAAVMGSHDVLAAVKVIWGEFR